MPSNSKLLTAEQLAEETGFAVRTILRFGRAGVIPVIKLGHRTLRYDKGHVEAALLRREIQARRLASRHVR